MQLALGAVGLFQHHIGSSKTIGHIAALVGVRLG